MPLGRDQAARVADAFALGSVEELGPQPARGEQGQTWELRTARGRFAVKELLVDQDETEAAFDSTVQERMHEAGVPLPRPLRTVEGTTLAAVDGRTVRVYEWAELLALDRSLELEAVGRLVAAIHSVVIPTTAPVDAWYAAPVGAPAWDDLLADLRTARAPFSDRLGALRDELLATERLLEAPTYTQVCHRDLFADNVRRTPDGGLCVIDWENCGAADPAQELAVVLLEYSWSDGPRARQLYAAYIEAGGPGRVRRRADFTMAIAQLNHILAHSVRRWLEATDDPTRARYAAAVAEFVDEPLTREAVDRVLDAIG